MADCWRLKFGSAGTRIVPPELCFQKRGLWTLLHVARQVSRIVLPTSIVPLGLCFHIVLPELCFREVEFCCTSQGKALKLCFHIVLPRTRALSSVVCREAGCQNCAFFRIVAPGLCFHIVLQGTQAINSGHKFSRLMQQTLDMGMGRNGNLSLTKEQILEIFFLSSSPI